MTDEQFYKAEKLKSKISRLDSLRSNLMQARTLQQITHVVFCSRDNTKNIAVESI